MTKIYNQQQFKQIRKNLRNQSHDVACEKIFWQKIRRNQIGYKFRRQFGIGKYVVDFYCPKLRLAVEIDGASHVMAKQAKTDKEREIYLESLNIKIKRYNNIDVKNNSEEVLNNLIVFCNNLKRIRF